MGLGHRRGGGLLQESTGIPVACKRQIEEDGLKENCREIPRDSLLASDRGISPRGGMYDQAECHAIAPPREHCHLGCIPWNEASFRAAAGGTRAKGPGRGR